MLRAAADAAQHAREQAWQALTEARRQHGERLARFGALAWTADPEQRLADAERDITTTKDELSAAQARIGQLSAEPAVLAQPADRLVQERAVWRVRRDTERAARRAVAPAASSPRPIGSLRPPEPVPYRTPSPGAHHGFGR